MYRVARVAARRAEAQVKDWRPTAIYVRGLTSFRPAMRLARKVCARIVYDARGLAAEEAFLKRGKWNLPAYYHRYREYESFRTADKLLCVSNGFRRWLEANIGRTDVEVVPCCVDDEFGFDGEAREAVRNELGWATETPVIAYCGGLSRWQRVDDVLCLLAKVKQLEPALKCLLLTSTPERMVSLAAQAGLRGEDYHCRRVGHADVSRYLSAADAGIILRHEDLVNRVASPIKIAEYLACGLGVICSNGIGDLSEMVSSEGVGVVVAKQVDEGMARQVAELLQELGRRSRIREKARRVARERLSWSAHLETYRRVYSVQ